jgi:S1-C subfamily serine protease
MWIVSTPFRVAFRTILTPTGKRTLSTSRGEADLIVAANGQGMTSVDDLHRFLAEWPINGSVALTIIRRQDRLTVEVTPVEAS